MIQLSPAETAKRAAYYPSQVTIDAHGNGGFRFAGMSHRGDLLCLPSGIHGWQAPASGELDEQGLGQIFAEAAAIEILLIGTGEDLVPLAPSQQGRLREVGIVGEAMATRAAVRTYNVLLAEGRAVAAVLIAVD